MQSKSDLRLIRTIFANGERYHILLNSVGHLQSSRYGFAQLCF